jgi:hypothetical protein
MRDKRGIMHADVVDLEIDESRLAQAYPERRLPSYSRETLQIAVTRQGIFHLCFGDSKFLPPLENSLSLFFSKRGKFHILFDSIFFIESL